MKHRRLLVDPTEVARGLEPAIYEVIAVCADGLLSVRQLGDDCGDELSLSPDRLTAVDDDGFAALQRIARRTRHDLRNASRESLPLIIYRARYKIDRVLSGVDG